MTEAPASDAARPRRTVATKAALARRFRVIMGFAYVVLVAVSLGLFVVELDDWEGWERDAIADRLREHVLILDALAYMVRSEASELRDQAETLAERFAAGSLSLPEVDAAVRRQAAGAAARFQMSGQAVERGGDGAVVGGARLDATSPEAQRQIEVAVALIRPLGHALTRMPLVERAHFLGTAGFRLDVPTPRDPAAYVEEEARALFRLAGPARNPTRIALWTAASGSRAEAAATISVPVYLGETLLGVLGLDIPLTYFRQVNADFPYDIGEVFLVNDDGRLLARSEEAQPAAMPASLAAAVPHAAGALAELARLPPRRIVGEQGYLLYHTRLESAPLTVVYAARRLDVLLPLVSSLAPQMLLVLAVLTVMLLIASRLTRVDLIDPAGRLIEHIAQAGGDPAAEPPRVPPGWRPWFRRVSAIFRENAEFASIRQELEIARNMQASILPKRFPDDLGVEIVARMQPAKEVGGDFYDYFRIDERRIGIVMADVSGKGVPAGLFMMVSRTLVKAAGSEGLAPGAALARVNDLLEAENEAAMFVTLFYGVYDLETGALVFANAGHNPPFLIHADGAIEEVRTTKGVALGVMPELDYAEGRLQLRPDDALFLYTDGLTEAFSAAGEEYTTGRLRASLEGQSGQGAAAVADAAIAAVESFATGAAQADDMTCLVLRVRWIAEARAAA